MRTLRSWLCPKCVPQSNNEQRNISGFSLWEDEKACDSIHILEEIIHAKLEGTYEKMQTIAISGSLFFTLEFKMPLGPCLHLVLKCVFGDLITSGQSEIQV